MYLSRSVEMRTAQRAVFFYRRDSERIIVYRERPKSTEHGGFKSVDVPNENSGIDNHETGISFYRDFSYSCKSLQNFHFSVSGGGFGKSVSHLLGVDEVLKRLERRRY